MSTNLTPLLEFPVSPFETRRGSKPVQLERWSQEDNLPTFGGHLDRVPRQSYAYTLELIEKAEPLTLLSEFARGMTTIQIAREYALDPLNFALWLERLPPDMKATRAIAEKAYAEHTELVIARRAPSSKTEGDHFKALIDLMGDKYKRATLLAAGIIPIESKDKLEFHIHLGTQTPPAVEDDRQTIDITPYDPRTPAQQAAPVLPQDDTHPRQDDHPHAQAFNPPTHMQTLLMQLDQQEDYFDED